MQPPVPVISVESPTPRISLGLLWAILAFLGYGVWTLRGLHKDIERSMLDRDGDRKAIAFLQGQVSDMRVEIAELKYIVNHLPVR
jgi:hypothetical protein